MSRRILVVIGTPLTGSFNHAIARNYAESAREAGADVRIIDLATDTVPAHPAHENELRAPRHDEDLPLAPEVADYLEAVTWAEHIVLVYPMWWGTYPAALKSFIDRVFLSGATFKYRPGRNSLPHKLLAGRTARILMTMDSPLWWNRFVYRSPDTGSLTRATLMYCGVKTKGITRFTPVRFSTQEQRVAWLVKAAKLGRKDGAVAGQTLVEASARADTELEASLA